jgi:hypothetical protein
MQMLTALRHHVPALLAIVSLSIAQFGIVFWYLKVALQYRPRTLKRVLAWMVLMTGIGIFPIIQLAIYGHALKVGRFEHVVANLWLATQAVITLILILVF